MPWILEIEIPRVPVLAQQMGMGSSGRRQKNKKKGEKGGRRSGKEYATERWVCGRRNVSGLYMYIFLYIYIYIYV